MNSSVITVSRTVILTLLAICFVLSTWGFIRAEGKQPDPMLDLRLFRIRNFEFGTVGAALNYLCFFLTLFLLPFYFDQILKLSSAQAGSYLAITPLMMTVCAPVAGTLSDRTGPRLLTTVGMLFSTIALVLFGFLAKLSSTAAVHGVLIIGLVLAGLGTGTFAAPNNSAILGAAPRAKQGVASGTLATFRYIGMMAGITLGGSLFDWLLGCFSKDGRGGASSFLQSFSLVMWVGAVFGVLGILCTLAMANASRNKQVDKQASSS